MKVQSWWPWRSRRSAGRLHPRRNYASQELPLEDNLSELIKNVLYDHKVCGGIVGYKKGPTLATYYFQPAFGTPLERILKLEKTLALRLRSNALVVRENPDNATVAIELPCERKFVTLADITNSPEWLTSKMRLPLAVGVDKKGDPFIVDLAEMPHLLIAGATGTGKSCCINSLLLSLLDKNPHTELGLVLIDPKELELALYEGLPHLLAPPVTSVKSTIATLEWLCKEMDRRYKLMRPAGVRNLDGYNAKQKVPEGKLRRIVCVVDELADLVMQSRKVEPLIVRLAQKARAAGIHLILATQRPSVDVVTGLIKANVPARLAFKTASSVDSMTILGRKDAKSLLGKGDCYFSRGADELVRAQGAFVSDDEVAEHVEQHKTKRPLFEEGLLRIIEESEKEEVTAPTVDEALYEQVRRWIFDENETIISKNRLLEKFRCGHGNAKKVVSRLEEEGVILPYSDQKKGHEVRWS